MSSPKSGTASEVAGIVSATIFRNTVRDRRMVTPAKEVRWLRLIIVKLECVKEVAGRDQPSALERSKGLHQCVTIPCLKLFSPLRQCAVSGLVVSDAVADRRESVVYLFFLF